MTKTLTLPAGPYVRVDGTGVNLTIAGQVLSGDFSFEKKVTGTAPNETTFLSIAAANIALRLGDANQDYVRVTNGRGALVIKKSGTGPGATNVLAGSVSAEVELLVPGVTFRGRFGVAFNNSAIDVNEPLTVGAVNESTLLSALHAGGGVALGTGPQLKITRRDTTTFNVNLIGATTVGDVLTAINTAAGAKIAVLEGTKLKLTDTVTTAGTFKVEAMNNSRAAADLGILTTSTTGVITGTDLNSFALVVPGSPGGGSYLKVSGTDVLLEIAGQQLGGNFSFEKSGTGTTQLVKIMASKVHLGLGDGTTEFVSLDNGRGSLIITPAGVAGEIAADVAVKNITDVSFSGSFRLLINNSAVAVNVPLAGTATVATGTVLSTVKGGDAWRPRACNSPRRWRPSRSASA